MYKEGFCKKKKKKKISKMKTLPACDARAAKLSIFWN